MLECMHSWSSYGRNVRSLKFFALYHKIFSVLRDPKLAIYFLTFSFQDIVIALALGHWHQSVFIGQMLKDNRVFKLWQSPHHPEWSNPHNFRQFLFSWEKALHFVWCRAWPQSKCLRKSFVFLHRVRMRTCKFKRLLNPWLCLEYVEILLGRNWT